LRFIFLSLLIYILLNLFTPFSAFFLKRSINNQIDFIADALSKEQDAVLQKKYPEGMSFSNAIFALAIIDFNGGSESIKKNHAQLVDRCINRLLSQNNKANFSKRLKLPYGAFYNGWCNFVLKKYLTSDLFSLSEFHLEFTQLHDSISQEIVSTQIDSFHLL